MSARWSKLRCVAVVFVIAATGCTPDTRPSPSPSPATITETPAPTPSAQPTGPRYDPVPAGFCDRIDWDAIASSLHITLSEADFVDWRASDPSSSPGGALPWYAACKFEVVAEAGEFRPEVSVAAEVYESDAGARQEFSNWVSTYRNDFGYDSEAIDGWWDEGARSVLYDPVGDRHWARVVYHLRHYNLRLVVITSGGYEVEGTTEEDFFGLIDDLSVGLVEAVTAHLPCRPSPDAAPVPVCH